MLGDIRSREDSFPCLCGVQVFCTRKSLCDPFGILVVGLRTSKSRLRGFGDLGLERARLRGFGLEAPKTSRIWAWSALVFKDFGLERARLRGFRPGAHQASRIWAWGAPGFEDLGLERARLRRFGPGGR